MLGQAQQATFSHLGVGYHGAVPCGEERGLTRAPAQDEVLQALERVLEAAAFARSPRLKAFLSYIVTQTLAGHADRIKGYTVAVEALGHGADHDPQTDPTVRVLACRLRQALALYYSGPGAGDTIRIDVPKGGYVPAFHSVPAAGEPMAGKTPSQIASSDPEAVDLMGPRRAVFDQISTTAAHLTHAASAIIANCDRNGIQVLGSHGMAAQAYGPELALCNLLDTTRPVIEIDDVAADPLLQDHPIQEVRPAVKRLIFVPLQPRADGRCAIVLVDPGPEFALTTWHGTLLCDLADLVARELKTLELLGTTGSPDVPRAA